MAARGDVQEQILFSAGATGKPVITVPTINDLEECCYITPVLVNAAYVASPDVLKQDTNSFYQFYDPTAVTAVTIDIQKCVSGAWATQHTIVDDTYGTFKDFGVEIINGKKYISIKNTNWSKIKVAFGEGVYRYYTNETTIYASEGVQHTESLAYDVKEFTEAKANFTTRFKIYNSGKLGDRNNPLKTTTFPADWEDQLRVYGFFGRGKSSFSNEYTVYNDGSKNYTKSERVKTFEFESDVAPQEVRELFENEVMMANLLEVTNYANNSDCYVDVPVIGASDFDPQYIKQFSKAKFVVGFEDAYANQEKLHC